MPMKTRAIGLVAGAMAVGLVMAAFTPLGAAAASISLGGSATVTASCVGPTGVEMEALCAVSAALLTIYDMCKAIDRGMRIENVQLDEKRGGKSGVWVRGESKCSRCFFSAP